MPEFIITYHGGKKPETKEEGMEGMEKWKAWAAGLGAALTNPGTPVGVTKVLTADGVSGDPSPHPLMGYLCSGLALLTQTIRCVHQRI